MKRALLTVVFAFLIVGAASAVEIRLKDGTVISADSYKLTGSYLMLQMPNGRHVAYDVADVDLDALRAAETASAPAETASEPPAETLSSGRSLKDLSDLDSAGSGSLRISDRDVKHVRGSGVRGDEEETEGEEPADGAEGVPAGFQQGGGVVLNGLRVTPVGEGQWQVDGEVVNRSASPVENVRVQLETVPSGGAEPWRGEVAESSFLGPNEKGTFSHGFTAEAGSGVGPPSIRASVIWMQQETTREPNYGRNAPHPSMLPLNRGGVGGADLRSEPIID
jgi:hypothetical protein